MHRIAVVALENVVPFDLSVPLEVFGRVTLANGKPGYDVRVCGVTAEVRTPLFRMKLDHTLRALRTADTVVLPGVSNVTQPVPEVLVHAVRAAAKRGARIVSICSGAFLLAATGLLDGRRATTHWLATDALAARFPRIKVDPNVLFVDAGQFLTSAGAAAGIDLCLHLVRRDFGAAIAADAARLSVVPLVREGGQAQFIKRAPVNEGAPLNELLSWIDAHTDDENVSLKTLAKRAATSVRTLSRQFKAQTGSTPLQWLLKARVRRSQLLLETTSHSFLVFSDYLRPASRKIQVSVQSPRFVCTFNASPARALSAIAGRFARDR
jgi:transcriptional regulator GlxA family with amidase domain